MQVLYNTLLLEASHIDKKFTKSPRYIVWRSTSANRVPHLAKYCHARDEEVSAFSDGAGAQYARYITRKLEAGT